MRSITPPEHEFHRYLSVYQLITQIFTQIYFFGECAKKASSLFEVKGKHKGHWEYKERQSP